MGADDVPRSAFAECVEFIDEDDAWGFGYGLLEHVADARRADADKHLDKVRTRKRKEWDSSFSRDRFGKQCFPGSRRTHKQHASWDSSAESLVLFWVLEKIHDLMNLLDRFIDPGNVMERNADAFLRIEFATRPPELHRRADAPHATHGEVQEG